MKSQPKKMSTYSLSEARKLSERISENLQASESETSLSEISENSASSKLTPEQKETERDDIEISEDELGEDELGEDELDEDELEEGEIREETIPCLNANSSRSLSVTNQDNHSLHLSVYTENDERKIYIYADSEFNLPVSAFREYMEELLEDDILGLERQRRGEFEDIVKASLAVGAFVAAGLILWLYYLLASLSRLR